MAQIVLRPPEDGEPAARMDVIAQQRDGQHGGAAELDEREQPPAQRGDLGRGGGEQGRGAGGRVHGLRQRHDGAAEGDGERAGQPAQGLEALAREQEEGLRDEDADGGGEALAEEEGARLREGRGERVVLEDGGGA